MGVLIRQQPFSLKEREKAREQERREISVFICSHSLTSSSLWIYLGISPVSESYVWHSVSPPLFPVKNNQNTRVPPSEGSVVSPSARISRPGTIMYCGVPGFAYKIIWASILPQTDLCHSEDSFTSPSLSLHWSLLNFSPSVPAPGDVIFSLNVQHLHWLPKMGRAMPLLW